MLLTLLQLAAFWTAKSSARYDVPSKTMMVSWVGGTKGKCIDRLTLQIEQEELDANFRKILKRYSDLKPAFGMEYDNSIVIPFKYQTFLRDGEQEQIYEYTVGNELEAYLVLGDHSVMVKFCKITDDRGHKLGMEWSTKEANTKFAGDKDAARHLVTEDKDARKLFILSPPLTSFKIAKQKLIEHRRGISKRVQIAGKDAYKNYDKACKMLKKGLKNDSNECRTEDAKIFMRHTIHVNTLPSSQSDWRLDEEFSEKYLGVIVDFIRTVADGTCFEDNVEWIVCSHTDDHERLAELETLFQDVCENKTGVTHIAHENIMQVEKMIASKLLEQFKKYRVILYEARAKHRLIMGIVNHLIENWDGYKLDKLIERIKLFTKGTSFEVAFTDMAGWIDSMQDLGWALQKTFEESNYPYLTQAEKSLADFITQKVNKEKHVI